MGWRVWLGLISEIHPQGRQEHGTDARFREAWAVLPGQDSMTLKHRKVTSDLLLYESKHLTTHAVCVGMTGSGKTGLGIGLLEEAAIDGIPVIAIDPKGDLGNLLLGFPELRPDDFLPWVDADEAGRRGQRSSNSPPRRRSSGRKDLRHGVRTGRGLRG